MTLGINKRANLLAFILTWQKNNLLPKLKQEPRRNGSCFFIFKKSRKCYNLV